jgi:hypothetical protein
MARTTSSSLGRALRNKLESQPLTTTLIALCLGWLLGRMHRPL